DSERWNSSHPLGASVLGMTFISSLASATEVFDGIEDADHKARELVLDERMSRVDHLVRTEIGSDTSCLDHVWGGSHEQRVLHHVVDDVAEHRRELRHPVD